MAERNQRRILSITENERVQALRERGILFLDDDISDELCHAFIRDLLYTRFQGFGDSSKPLWIVINSRGGRIHSGFAIYDLIWGYVEDGLEINGVGMGMVASMAVDILQAVKTRYALPHTQFGIHQASKWGGMEDEEVNLARERVEELERTNKISMEIVSRRTGMDLDELLKISKKTDRWYDAEAALKFGKHGLIDKILPKLPF